MSRPGIAKTRSPDVVSRVRVAINATRVAFIRSRIALHPIAGRMQRDSGSPLMRRPIA
jgi:hypothetical protein